MKVYTKKGDKGTTSLLGTTHILKSELRIRAYGHVDELNSNIGLLIAYIKDIPQSIERQNILDFLQNLQFQLFHIGSHLACTNSKILADLPPLQEIWITHLEEQIDDMTKNLPQLKNFILPGGSKAACQAHICRTTCRKAECICVDLNSQENINPVTLIYLNRMSDYFFTLSRYINYLQKNPDVIWTSSHSKTE